MDDVRANHLKEAVQMLLGDLGVGTKDLSVGNGTCLVMVSWIQLGQGPRGGRIFSCDVVRDKALDII